MRSKLQLLYLPEENVYTGLIHVIWFHLYILFGMSVLRGQHIAKRCLWLFAWMAKMFCPCGSSLPWIGGRAFTRFTPQDYSSISSQVCTYIFHLTHTHEHTHTHIYIYIYKLPSQKLRMITTINKLRQKRCH